MSYGTIIYEKKGSIAYVKLNRPQVLNAVNAQMLDELLDVFRDVRRDGNIRVAILISTNERAFSTGGDIQDWENRTPLAGYRYTCHEDELIMLMENLGKPIIGAIDGHCLAAGLELATACTLLIASERAKFGQPEINVGSFGHNGGTSRLPRIVGRMRAMEMLLTGRSIDAQEAHRSGLVTRVVPPDILMAAAEELAQELAGKPPIAVEFAMASINACWETALPVGRRYEILLGSLLWATEDMAEGGKAFLEKRKPVYRGR